MFKKIGESLPITNCIDDSGIMVCPSCQEPLSVIAILEDEGVAPICNCKYLEVEQLDA